MRRPIGSEPLGSQRPPRSSLRLLRAELVLDRVHADVTTRALLPRPRPGRAVVLAQSSGILSGAAASARLARSVGLRVQRLARDGSRLRPGRAVLRLSGDVRWILGIERTVLNALMHLSGVATATARAVEAVRASGGDVAVYATRKTLPGLRELEKAAVVHGGGHPHRRDLADGFLAKSPHLELVPIPEAVVRLRRAAGRHRSVQIEVRTAAEALSAVGAGADALLIDNAGPARSRTIVEALDRAGLRSKVWIEISGGITLRSVGRYARSGADAVSLGALTHSAAAVPFHLRLELPRGSPRT